MNDTIAVVGMACRYPDANTPQQFWENILARRRAFRRIPLERLNLDDYLSVDDNSGDTIYASEAAVIEGYEFDRIKYCVAGSTYRSVDLAHWLALDVAAQALEDAGFAEGDGLPRTTTGVLVGNTLTGEFSRAAMLRLRWPYVRRVFDSRLRSAGWSSEDRQSFLLETEIEFKAPFEPVGEETLAGGLSNTIAGRICNHFNLGGGGYILDGACSSSLLAVANACTGLNAGDLDVVLVGGVDISLDPFELIGFSKIGALAHGDMLVYDRNSNGFLPGEGCGFVVLMRYDDTLKQGLRSYGLIQGWGISSDGSGGITRPEIEGQRLALQRAYRRAGYSIDSVALFEGHGTGTSVGDEVELSALSTELKANGAENPAVIGSVKANIGHTKAAAGVAGFIKATMALHNRLIPPSTGISNPHRMLDTDKPILRISDQGQRWPENRPMRSSVSSFGFGGINVHVTLEESEGNKQQTLTAPERKQLFGYQDAELFFFSGNSQNELQKSMEHFAGIANRLSYAELGDFAAALAHQTDATAEIRAAIVASSPGELSAGLQALLTRLDQDLDTCIDPVNSIFLGSGQQHSRIAFLFPGQASPVRLDGGLTAKRFSIVNEVYQRLRFPGGADPMSTAVAQPAIIASELAGLKLLQRLGVTAHAALGHSLGELMALHWAGVFDEDTLLRLTQIRGSIMENVSGPAGTMVSLVCSSENIADLLEVEQDVVIAGFNGPDRIVVAGEKIAVERFIKGIQAKGIAYTRLPVSHGFHSPLMKPAAPELESCLVNETFRPIKRVFLSTITGTALQGDVDITRLLTKQLTAPVRFTEAVTQLLDNTDLFLEVGTGNVLAGLLNDWVEIPVISLDMSGPSLRGLLQALGAAYAMGVALNREELFADRFSRPFDLDWHPDFFTNPCELAPLPDQETSLNIVNPKLKIKESHRVPGAVDEVAIIDPDITPLDLIRRLVAQKTELPISTIQRSSRLLADLHLNSISVAELTVAACRELGLPAPAAPTEYSNATVAEIAESLTELKNAGLEIKDKPDGLPPGVDAWVRSMTIEWNQQPLKPNKIHFRKNGDWQSFCSAEHSSAQFLLEELRRWGGCGVLLYQPSDFGEGDINLLLEAVNASLKQTATPHYFLLIQQHGNCGAASVARTLHLESRNLITLVIEAPLDHPQVVSWILSEIEIANGYIESYYDNNGKRWRPLLKPLPFPSKGNDFPLGATDVLLVSGGGKGIAAECALVLARETGTKLALLGRSDPRSDPELSANLARFSAHGIDYRYLSTDVRSFQEVQVAVASIESDLGTITGLLHGAGINYPRLLQAADESTFALTLAPKVHGLDNLLQSVRAEKLRLLISFGSIIARTGMRGEGDYALANQWQTRLTERFKQQHPKCRCLAIEWSVWSGVGMGERLGRMDALLQEGVTPIPPDQGVSILRQLITSKLTKTTVIVSGRLGKVPTLEYQAKDLPFLRFLEQSRVYYPGIELVVEAEISTDSDPYLDDHIFQGERLLPAVMGLEAMAQVAMALAEVEFPPVFEDVEFAHPLVISGQEKLILRIAALIREPDQIEVVIRCNKSNFLTNHFRCRCLFGKNRYSKARSIRVKSSLEPVQIDTKKQLYGNLFFHNGRFVRISRYGFLSAWQCNAEIIQTNISGWFSRYLPQTLVLGDPGSRDAALHAIQACIPHAMLIPVGLEKMIPGDIHCPGPWTLHARERSHTSDKFIYDLEIIGTNGVTRECWEGLQLKKIASFAHEQWLEALLAPTLERQLEDISPGKEINVTFLCNFTHDRSLRGDKAMHTALRDQTKIYRRTDGKPMVKENRQVSVAHCEDLSLAVASFDTVSCDIEQVMDRNERFWNDILGKECSALARQFAKQSTENYDTAATRMWASLECLKKAGLSNDTPLVLKSCSDGWVILDAGRHVIATYVATLQKVKAPVAMAILMTV